MYCLFFTVVLRRTLQIAKAGVIPTLLKTLNCKRQIATKAEKEIRKQIENSRV